MIPAAGRASALAAAIVLAFSGMSPSPLVAAEPAWEDAVVGAPPPEPSGYRMDHYRTPTPLTLAGAKAVDTKTAETLWREKRTVFIDTMPRDRHPDNLPPGTIWRDKPREHIPGSLWLINVGYGALAPDMEAYFRAALDRSSGGDRAKPLLFYCRAACWMSWNAAKRAMEWGYKDVIWYSAGTDGWAEAGLPLERATPFELAAPTR